MIDRHRALGDIDSPPSSAKCCVFYRVQWIHTTGFELLAREALHDGNLRSASVDAPIVALMRVFLTSMGCFCKTRPPGWWVLGEVLPMIKLWLIGRVKSGVLLKRQSFFFC
ncbi:hypothetical protein BHE74_00036554 [Ensete ventricosum]|nr:hypothetical protein BHE74_00036554 [Ensete ventricosum]